MLIDCWKIVKRFLKDC